MQQGRIIRPTLQDVVLTDRLLWELDRDPISWQREWLRRVPRLDLAFPTVAATETSSTSSNVTQVVDLPTGIIAGNLLTIFLAISSAFTATTPSNWTLIDPFPVNGTSIRLYAWWKIATGSEGSTQNVTVSTSTSCAHLSLRITGAHPTDAPQGDTASSGISTNPDPPNNDRPAVAADHLWIAIEAGPGAPVSSAAPSNYSGLLTATVGGPSLSLATRQLNAASENPGAFTKNTSNAWVANTIVVYPAVTIIPRVMHLYNQMRGH